jgi:hypothetical protein
MPTLRTLAVHNLDAISAGVSLVVFAAAGWPLDGWFWATALWALNRYLQSVTERRAARMGALRGVGLLGASMLLRPWVGMLALFLITRNDRTTALSAALLFVLLVTIDIATRIVTHRNIGGSLGGTA